MIVTRHQIGLFVFVGSIGFVVDSGTLWLLMNALNVGAYAGRAVSFTLAASVTWVLNRALTYKDRDRSAPLARQWVSYMAASSLGAVVNYATFCALVLLLPLAFRHPIVAVAAGSVAGLVFNFNIYSNVIFRDKTSAANTR